MEIKIRSLLWLHSTGVWGGRERWFQHGNVWFCPPAHGR